MIERFREWGAGLSDEDFACAVAAFGVLGGTGSPSRTGDAFRWRFDSGVFAMSALDLAKAWRYFRADFHGPVRVRLDLRNRSEIVPSKWVQIQLAFAGAICLHDESPEGTTRGAPHLMSYSIHETARKRRKMNGGGAARVPVKTHGKKKSPRFLQARIQSGKRLIRGALRPGQLYSAAIRIGLPDPDWSSVAKPFPTPEEPPEPNGHRLTVIFWEPRLRPEPEVKTLWLPRTGSSDPVEFSLEPPADVTLLTARITVLHANRVLQTGLLKAPIGTKGKWTFKLDATPRTRLEGLSTRTLFDAALVLNHDGDGNPRVTAASDGQAVVLNIDDSAIQMLTRALGRRISDIAFDPARYKGLESAGSVELLRELAQKGAVLHDHLCKHTWLARLADARRIHITSAKAESFFPAELLYRHRPPSNDAKLCPHALRALKAGDCTGGCPSDKSKTICPLGFWGLSKVIERHAHRPEDQGRGDVELRPEPVRERSLLPISGYALLAASVRVSAYRKDAVTHLLDKLKKRGSAVLATTWDEWRSHVKSKRPRLLVLVPHHERDDKGDEFLEIGEDPLDTHLIWVDVIRRDPGGPHPVVLLMGCETNLAEISFENPVIRFRDQGASIVVSTIATILGRHASPATEALIQLLDKMADGKHTFGEIMLRLRQKLVATSTPMALGLTSYGDADWILTREG